MQAALRASPLRERNSGGLRGEPGRTGPRLGRAHRAAHEPEPAAVAHGLVLGRQRLEYGGPPRGVELGGGRGGAVVPAGGDGAPSRTP